MSQELIQFVRSIGFEALKGEPYHCSVYKRHTNAMVHITKETVLDATTEQLNGLVFELDDEGLPVKLICSNHRITLETAIDGPVVQSSDNYDWYMAFDGSMIRYYYHEDQWKIASNKKIDANEAFWGTKRQSFGSMANQLFLNGQNDLPDCLDTSKTYLTLLRHTDAYLTLPTNESYLYFIGTVDNETLECTYANKYAFAGDEQDKLDLLFGKESLMVETNVRGLIAVNKSTGQRFKVDGHHFTHVAYLKGHDQDPRVRYLKLYTDSEEGFGDQRDFAMCFGDTFNRRELDDLAKLIHKVYLHLFVFKGTVDESVFHPFEVSNVPNFFMFLLNKLHQDFRHKRTKRTLAHVKALLTAHAEPFVKMVDAWVHRVEDTVQLRYKSFEELNAH